MSQQDLPVYSTRWSSNRVEDQFIVDNPATGKPIAIVQGGGAQEVDAAVRAGDKAFNEHWRWVSPHERGKILRQCAVVIKDHIEEIAQLETYEEGKPIHISRSDMRKCVEAFEYFGGLIGNLPTGLLDLGPVYAPILLEPYGVIGGVLPFNWPPLHTAAKSAPALAVGNTIVLKPGDQAPLAVMRIVEVLQEVLPPDVIQCVVGPGLETGKALVAHPLVRKISFTGSSNSGRAILKQAADNITPCMMELGGKNPLIIMEDADIDELIPVAYEGVFYNNGQACTAISRIIIHRSLHDKFVEKFAPIVRKVKVGDGADEASRIGALVSKDQQHRVLEYIELGQKEGAIIAAQGKLPEDSRLKDGYFVPPTLFTGVRSDMRIAQEEIFGPVACVIPFDTEEEGIAIANDSEYGLVGVVYSKDQERAMRIARKMDVGTAYVNNFYRWGLDCVPFGGNKASGFGRERSVETLHEFGRSKSMKILSGVSKPPQAIEWVLPE